MKPKPEPFCRCNPDQSEQIRLRRLRPEDSLEQLTGMLHRAFSRLGKMGLGCSCVNQTTDATRERVARGECFVATSGERIVGTITLYAPDTASESRHYRNARIASIRQLAVDPRFQGKGVGSALLRVAENWARHRGYARLALDTPEPAAHLVAYYRRQGFRIEQILQFPDRGYRSVIFAKTLLCSASLDPKPLTRPGSFCLLNVPQAAANDPQQHADSQAANLRP